LSLAQSRALLDRLVYVDLARAGQGAQHLRLDDAWPSRTDKALQAQLAAFMLGAGSLPLQVNPAYKNALLSLLRVLAQFSGNDEKAFHAAWAQYLSDRADADTIANGVEAALKGGD